MKIILIAAMTKDRLIGREGKIPWHEPDDLRHFKQTTMGHAVIMGRKTFDEVGKPLPGRRNIVITRNRNWTATGADVVHSLSEAIELCRQRGEASVFVVGGAEIYKEALPIADEMIITEIDRPDATGDTYFPAWNADEWEATAFPAVGTLRVMRYTRK